MLQPVVEVKVAKNRVQPANSLQVKCFFSRAMTGGRMGGSPHFSLLHDFRHRLLALISSNHLIYPNPAFLVDRAAGRL